MLSKNKYFMLKMYLMSLMISVFKLTYKTRPRGYQISEIERIVRRAGNLENFLEKFLKFIYFLSQQTFSRFIVIFSFSKRHRLPLIMYSI